MKQEVVSSGGGGGGGGTGNGGGGKTINDERISSSSSSSSADRTLKRFELAAARRKQQQQQQQEQHQQKLNQKTQQLQSQSSAQMKALHRRQESDSKLGNASAFARAFRRENSDFFPSTRHSAYLQKSEPRSSIFASGNRRGSEISVAGIAGKKGTGLSAGEPVLTDFSFGRDGGPQRPRREKTESEIVFGNRHQHEFLRERAEARSFLRDTDDTTKTTLTTMASRRRSCRPTADNTTATLSDDAGTIKSTASTTASEYSPVITQVSLVEPPLDCLSACQIKKKKKKKAREPRILIPKFKIKKIMILKLLIQFILIIFLNPHQKNIKFHIYNISNVEFLYTRQ